MFYVKHYHQGHPVQVEITDENVYTNCVKCGDEMPVDLSDMFKGGDFDICGTVVFCTKCSAERIKAQSSKAAEFWEIFQQLPDEGKQEVIRYMDYLKRQHACSTEEKVLDGLQNALRGYYQCNQPS